MAKTPTRTSISINILGQDGSTATRAGGLEDKDKMYEFREKYKRDHMIRTCPGYEVLTKMKARGN